MNPRNLPIAALALLGLAVAPAQAEVSNPSDGEAQTARTTRQHLGRKPVHRRGAKSGRIGDEGPAVGDDEQGRRKKKKKKKAKRNGKKKKKKAGRRGHGHKKKRGTPPDQG